MKLKIKKSDTVMVITGKYKGKTGRVLEIYPETQRILIEQVNIKVKHEKPSQNNQKGGKVHKEMPIHYSNVQILDGNQKPTRIGIKLNDKGENTRYAKTNGKTL